MQLAGIGVGPANLSLASLLYPLGLPNTFFEKAEGFRWHEGMQIPNSALQVSFVKDLVTLADPTNPFSFLAFLHDQGRLGHFLNARFDAVSRREFSRYFAWAAERNPNVRFGEEVLEVDFDGDFVLRTSCGIVRSANLSIGVGMRPALPPFAEAKRGATVFHSSDYMRHAQSLGDRRVAVIGGGQSGAEIVLDLATREHAGRPAQIVWITRRTCFLPLDDSAFTNDLFLPCHQHYFSELDEAHRHRFLQDHVLASDGISGDTLQRLYQTLYVRRFLDGAPDAVSLLPNRTLTHIASEGAGWLLQLHHRDLGAAETVTADVVVLATGYRNAALDFLQPIAHRIETVDQELKVDEAFAVSWDGPQDRSIFVQNAARRQKGLADPNLSLLAWRSDRIIERLTGLTRRVPERSMITWAPEPPAASRESAHASSLKFA
ncbi:SidA/IucD/PvdA family monooxygenase [uncultured Methylobacterium sp.]|uniref:lysine N(6)-hydroxylase/L-ornithine N(5)-oxygenase family protein n=1 Tax=uncultured Methylobacterium sp. TaxID=157278 RepID=UPI0025961A56|nr:SidA/IucD/PvdA family monooxygenase [uncultured Methylobacterium sp.]